MYTEQLLCQLARESDKTKAIHYKDGGAAPEFQLDNKKMARIYALAEVLGIRWELLLDELLDCALGDAHDGFLSAYIYPKDRDEANKQLKIKVKKDLARRDG